MTIEAVLNNGSTCTEPLMQYDTGQKVHLSGAVLPASYMAEFSNSVVGTAEQIAQTSTTIAIPDEYLTSGKPIHIWIVTTSTGIRTTVYEIIVPIETRGVPEDYEPEPSERTLIENYLNWQNSQNEYLTF